ncbi:MAG: glycosyltransferase [Acidimicrobiales bacterium]
MPQGLIGLPVEQVEPPDAAAAGRAGVGRRALRVVPRARRPGKGTHDLVERFARFRDRTGGGRLVLAGPVAQRPPTVDGVRCLGPVPEEHKSGLLAAADVLVNPSPHESFSLVILEAWLAGTPVLVNGWCGPWWNTAGRRVADSPTPAWPTSRSAFGDCSTTRTCGTRSRRPAPVTPGGRTDGPPSGSGSTP